MYTFVSPSLVEIQLGILNTFITQRLEAGSRGVNTKHMGELMNTR
jgi:hypothetical protein